MAAARDAVWEEIIIATLSPPFGVSCRPQANIALELVLKEKARRDT